ncbi:MAG TPA: FAD-dependent oxidoreductase [Candidatus Galloscillospira excrementavium]|nr:FAD-dependent oxidoreductase [Candidatus Galloscillospira excrementavium]
MDRCKYPHLFTPIILGGTYFRNRIFASPQGPTYAHSDFGERKDSKLNEEAMAFFARRAQGGVASLCVGDATIDSIKSRANGFHLALDDHSFANTAYLTRFTDTITRHGAIASVEICHYGSSSRRSWEAGETIYGPVACDTVNLGMTIHAEEMPEEMIEKVIQQYADAAVYAKQCGFGMVTIHGGHGWLFTQFLSESNNRKDKWGGSFENRMRFPVAVCDAVKKAVGPNFPVEIRITGSECYEKGFDIDYGVATAKMLDGHVDLIHVSAGSHEVQAGFTVMHPSMFKDDGCNVRFAAEIKKHVKTPVATVGSLSDPEMMEEIIASGKADVVEMARSLMADPDLPIKAHAGRREEIRQCLRCTSCFSDQMMRGRCTCAINPEINNELDYRFQPKPVKSCKVLVAGGGIGGMEAAIECAKLGHQVVLCEKTGRLGGVLRCEEKVPFKRHLEEYLDYQARQIAKYPNIEVRLNTAVTPEYAAAENADAIISALGARPAVPPIPGLSGGNVISAEELYQHPERAGERVVILGGGLVGSELAVFLSMQGGHTCTVVEMAPVPNDGGNVIQGWALQGEFEKYGVTLSLSTKAKEVRDDGVVCEREGEEVFFPADTVVTALGMKPLREESDALSGCAPEFYAIGDCVAPRTIKQATAMAYQTARNIGRIAF